LLNPSKLGDTTTGLNNLARLLQSQSDLTAARPLLVRALAVRKKVHGAEHPHKQDHAL
jgi:Tetratricopeptide repeat